MKVQQGDWKAVFVKAGKKVTNLPQSEDDSLVRELVARGITPRSAQKLVSHHERSRIEEKIRLFDATRSRGGEGGIRNRAGWLYSAIVNDYSAGDESSPNQSTTARVATTPPPSKGVVEPDSPEVKPEVAAFEAFWGSLDEAAREAFEAEAVSAAPAFLQKQYLEGKTAPGSLWKVTRDRILLAHFRRRAD